MWKWMVRLFDWSVTNVSYPQPRFHPEIKSRLVAYQVTVTYAHHGSRVVCFPVGDYGLFNTSQSFAYRAASQFCDKMRAGIKQKNR